MQGDHDKFKQEAGIRCGYGGGWWMVQGDGVGAMGDGVLLLFCCCYCVAASLAALCTPCPAAHPPPHPARFNAANEEIERLRAAVAAKEGEVREAKQAEQEFAAEVARLDEEKFGGGPWASLTSVITAPKQEEGLTW